MKKTISSLTALIAVITLTSVFVSAETTTVYVTISDVGDLVLVDMPVNVTDTDGDGALTLNDALACAHTQYAGEKQYLSADTDYGKSLITLWGNTNGGAYGYYINNAGAMSLLDEIKQGDRVYAYSYSDLTGYSDAYTYFEADASDETVALTLYSMHFDDNWNLVNEKVAGAVITLDGNATEYKTDADGRAFVFLSNAAGTHIISAEKDGCVFVPAFYKYTVESRGVSPITALIIVMAIAAAFAVFSVILIKKAHLIKNA